MVLIHGFGGNADHWRRNMAALSKTGPAYAIDLLGERMFRRSVIWTVLLLPFLCRL